MTLMNRIYDNTLSYLHVFKFPPPDVLAKLASMSFEVILIPANHKLLDQFTQHVMFTPDDRGIPDYLGTFNGVPVVTETTRSRGRTHNLMFCDSLNRLGKEALKELE